MATPRLTISFTPAATPITTRVTKFGGQPVWLGEPCWPLSRSSGNPMRFVGQVEIPAHLFASVPAKMAYVFMTQEDDYVEWTWDPQRGENAVVLQPGAIGVEVNTAPLRTGPTVIAKDRRPIEFEVGLQAGNDEPNQLDDDDLLDDATDDGNKLGGLPAWLQEEDFPGAGWSRLLLQLDQVRLPFFLNLGDGRAFVFLSPDGPKARMLWQR